MHIQIKRTLPQLTYKHFRLLLYVLLVFQASFMSISYTADFASETDSNLSKSKKILLLRKKIKVLENKLGEIYQRQGFERKALREVDRIVAGIDHRLRKKKLLLEKLDHKLLQLQTRKLGLSDQIKKNQQAVAAQIRQDFAMLNQNKLRVVMSVKELPKLKRGLVYQKYVNLIRRKKLKQIQARLVKINQLNRTIAIRQAAIDQGRRQQSEMKLHFQRESNRRTGILAKLDKSEKKYRVKVKRLKQDEAELNNVYRFINTEVKTTSVVASPVILQFPQLKGKLLWPTSGSIVSSFGRGSAAGLMHKQGVLISTAGGQAVKTIANGRVVFADWLGSFGMIIIVDHGSSYLSLYGHNRSLHKKVGENVRLGEVIASAGSSGGVKRTALYFEIRKQGIPQNPSRWCKFWPQPH